MRRLKQDVAFAARANFTLLIKRFSKDISEFQPKASCIVARLTDSFDSLLGISVDITKSFKHPNHQSLKLLTAQLLYLSSFEKVCVPKNF